MSKFFDWNRDRGTWYEYQDNPDGSFSITTKQDMSGVLDWIKKKRNSGVGDKVQEMNHYATIPAHVELELRQKGINIYDKNNTKRLLDEINRNYPHLKTTNLHHQIK